MQEQGFAGQFDLKERVLRRCLGSRFEVEYNRVQKLCGLAVQYHLYVRSSLTGAGLHSTQDLVFVGPDHIVKINIDFAERSPHRS